MAEPVAVAVFAKAPIPGYAKTRLIPVLGAEGAAELQERLIDRALAVALAAKIGPATLWCAPSTNHPFFRARAGRLRLRPQQGEDLGARMLAAFRERQPQPLVLIGSDCPSLRVRDLRAAADALRAGAEIVICPAEDGGYGLIGARRPIPVLFERMPWGSDRVAELTRKHAEEVGLTVTALRTIWDVDTPADHARLARESLLEEPV